LLSKEIKLGPIPLNVWPVAFLKDKNIEKLLGVVFARHWMGKFQPAYCAEEAVTDKR
jgi:hypothetical protein